jgi:hypothetical protein
VGLTYLGLRLGAGRVWWTVFFGGITILDSGAARGPNCHHSH